MSKKIGKLAKRYAKALLAAVEKELGTSGSPTSAQQVATGMEELAKLWNTNRELNTAILSPAFKRQQRRAALQKIAKEAGLPEVAARFLLTVFDRERIGAFPEIVQSFREFADDAAHVVAVTIQTAGDVPENERQEIEGGLRQHIGGKPQFEWSTDRSLLGGIVVRYKGQVLDGSLSGRLDRLERSLLP